MPGCVRMVGLTGPLEGVVGVMGGPMVPPALPPVRLLEPAPGRDPGRMEGPQPLVGPTGGAVGILRGLQLAPVTSLW